MNVTATRPEQRATEPVRLLTCEACGRVGVAGVEVITTWEWLGGVGHVLRTWCVNKLDCWARRGLSGA